MSRNAPSAIIVGALALSLASCSIFRRSEPVDSNPNMLEIGASETVVQEPSPEGEALGHYLAGVLAMNSGDQAGATAAFEAAVAADPNGN